MRTIHSVNKVIILDIHYSLHVNHCYWQGIMIQLKVHGKISIATAHWLEIHVKQIFSHVKIMRHVRRIIKYYITYVIVKGIGESAVD